MNCLRLLRFWIVPVLFGFFCSAAFCQAGKTDITRWQYGRRAAVSLTYDDGTINQFRVAVPILDSFKIPATFFIITGEIAGSQYHGTFIGRPVKSIIQETASVSTNKDNFFERASAIGFLGYQGASAYHTRAGATYDERKDFVKAYQLIDEAYTKVRQGDFKLIEDHNSPNRSNIISWDELAEFAKHGHEFASHTVTHPRLAALDDANLIYELEKSRQDILDHLGVKHIFSVECPYGTENERAVQYALKRYQLARNYMPDSFVEDLDRSSTLDPDHSNKEYVRWQRGVLTATPMTLMKSWIDTSIARGNIWLVLVFHGVDDVGWEPTPHEELTEYLTYMTSKKDLWVGTFQDVAKYIRERMHSEVSSYVDGETISVVLRDDLAEASYDLPLTLKTYVPSQWAAVTVVQGRSSSHVQVIREQEKNYVLYQAEPNAEVVKLLRAQP